MSDKQEQLQEVEQAFLGSLLITDPEDIPHLTIQPLYFYLKSNGLIFKTYQEQRKNNIKPNILTLCDDPDLASVDPSYIASLTNKNLSVANIQFYESKIIKAWQTRTAKYANERFKARIEAADFSGDIELEIRKYIEILSGALCDKNTDSPIVTYEGYRQRRADRKYWEEFAPAFLCRLPIPDGSIHLIGGRTGSNKTSALINIMRELLETVAPDTVTNNKHREQLKNATRRMVFVSREMIADDILDRLALSLAWANKGAFPCLEELEENPFFNILKFHTSLKYPDIPPEDSFKAYSYVLENIIDPAMRSGRLVILDVIDARTLEEILLKLTRLHIGPGDVVLIDYIQILPATTNKEAERYANTDYLRMRYIVHELRKAAKKSGAIFICAAQLNREAAREQAEGKTNIETAFKDSADLEQAAHSAVIINRKDGKGGKPPVLSFHVVKARSSHHLGLCKNIVWKSGFYHMELEEEGEVKPTPFSGATSTETTEDEKRTTQNSTSPKKVLTRDDIKGTK